MNIGKDLSTFILRARVFEDKGAMILQNVWTPNPRT